MDDRSTDIFGPMEDNNDENVEEEEEVVEEEDSSSSEKEEEADDDEPDPWSPLPQNVGEDLKEPYLKEVSISWIKENPKAVPKMLLSMPCYL